MYLVDCDDVRLDDRLGKLIKVNNDGIGDSREEFHDEERRCYVA